MLNVNFKNLYDKLWTKTNFNLKSFDHIKSVI